MDITTTYLGHKLKSPFIAVGSGQSASLDNLCRLEDAGAGAVILNSVFEEQIIFDIKRNTSTYAPVSNYGASYEYVSQQCADDYISKHLRLIEDAKRRLHIPVIGSIDCYQYESWLNYATKFQAAGCDALEFNISILPYDPALSVDDVERTFNDIISIAKKSVSIPISIKVSPYFTDMAKCMQTLSWMGIQGITLFNRPMIFDIDTEGESLVYDAVESSTEEFQHMLRWVFLLSNKLRCQISAASGVSTADDVVKALLAGASTVQIGAHLCENGAAGLRSMSQGLCQWMEKKGYENLSQFRAKLSFKGGANAAMLERIEYMKHYFMLKN